jgi:hypothetical protein
MSWKKVSNFPPMWMGVESEEVDGVVESVKESQFGEQYGIRLSVPSIITLYDIEKKEQMNHPTELAQATLISMPNHAILVGKLTQVPIGSRVKITVGKKIPSKKKGMSDSQDYNVEVWTQ